jgi:hypothetical protein
MAARKGVSDGIRLVCVKLVDAASAQHLPQVAVDSLWAGRVLSRPGRHPPDGGDPAVGGVGTFRKSTRQTVDDGLKCVIVSRIRPSPFDSTDGTPNIVEGSCRQHDREW